MFRTQSPHASTALAVLCSNDSQQYVRANKKDTLNKKQTHETWGPFSAPSVYLVSLAKTKLASRHGFAFCPTATMRLIESHGLVLALGPASGQVRLRVSSGE